MNEHDTYHQQEETQRMNNSNVRHGERVTRYPEKEAAHTSCLMCLRVGHKDCVPAKCIDPTTGEREDFTPAPAPAPKVTDEQADKFCEVVVECFKLGMGTNGIQVDPEDVIAFIRTLAQRAGEGYTVWQINAYLESLKSQTRNGSYNVAIEYARTTLKDERFGIAASTNKKGGRDDNNSEK